MGKTRDLFKKIGDIRGTLPARMGTIKNRNGKAIRGAEEIKKRGQEYTELYKKGLNDLDAKPGVCAKNTWPTGPRGRYQYGLCVCTTADTGNAGRSFAQSCMDGA